MQFRVVWDQFDTCPYREGQVARLPLRLPMGPIGPALFDQLLEQGDRRSGRMLYRTRCPECSACHPLRVPTDRFVPTRGQRRVARANTDVEVRIAPPTSDDEHVTLYNRHRLERALARNETALSAEQYRSWLVTTCVPSVEVQYRVEGELFAVSVLDIGERAVSSVYHYFNPDHHRRSPGVFSAIWELDWARRQGKYWYYFGFYVEDCRHLSYKADYYPHQRRVDGRWFEYAAPGAAPVEVAGG